MNYLDAIFAIAFLWSIYRGVTKGFIIMAASLAALLLGIWGAVYFSDLTAGFLTNRFNFQSQYLHIISFALTFIIIVILVHLFARGLDRLVKAVALGFVNRLAGVLFGILKTALILSVLLVFVNAINKKFNFIPEEQQKGSLLYQPLSKLAPAIFPYLDFEKIKERIVPEEEPSEEVDV